MMSNCSLESLSPLHGAREENGTYTEPGIQKYDNSSEEFWSKTLQKITNTCIVIISILGLIGNGMVIWFLGFRLKRNTFTTFILNLAVADHGTLIFLSASMIITLLVKFQFISSHFYSLEDLCTFSFLFMYFTGQYLLTAISIDRCASVVFPIWYRCHRPRHLSTILCSVIWILSFLFTVIHFTVWNVLSSIAFISYLFLFTALTCIPLMTIATLILFKKIYFTSQQRKQRKALTVILLSLLFFLFLAFPLNFIYLSHAFLECDFQKVEFVGYFCSCLNSSLNPLIYFLIGRKKRGQSREKMKVILERLFKEERDSRDELELPVQTEI